MKTLAIDPSITRTGYAVLTAPEACGLLDAGFITVQSAKQAWVSDRMSQLFLEVSKLVFDVRPDRVVVEVPTHHVSLGRPGAGLTTYGMAVGAVWCACGATLAEMATADPAYEPKVVSYDEREWTGAKAKRIRTRRIVMQFPQYRADNDPGGDIADAIGLGVFDFAEQKRVAMYTTRTN